MCVCVLLLTSLLDRAREATRDRATHVIDCAGSSARWVVVVAAVVPHVVAARARVCVCVCVSIYDLAPLIDRAREAARDRATHSNACARSTARWVAVVVVAVAVVPYAVVARACVCVCLCCFVCFTPRSGP